MWKPLILLFFLVLMVACNQPTTNDKNEQIKAFEESFELDNLFEYSIPENYSVVEDHGTKAKLVLMDKINISSINIITSYPSLTPFNMDSTLLGLKMLYPNVEILDHRQFKIEDKLAYQVNFSIESNQYMNFSTIGLRHKDFLAILTLTCAKENYEYGLNSMSELINSIKFKDNIDQSSLKEYFDNND